MITVLTQPEPILFQETELSYTESGKKTSAMYEELWKKVDHEIKT